MVDNKVVELVKLWNEASVTILVNNLIALKNKSGENDRNGKNTEYNALCHNKTDILAE